MGFLTRLKSLFSPGQDVDLTASRTSKPKPVPETTGPRHDAKVEQREEILLLRGAFGTALMESLANLPPAEQALWQALVEHAATAEGLSKPSAKWLQRGSELMEAAGKGAVAAKIIELLEQTTPDPAIVDRSLDLLKALVWLSAKLDHSRLALPIGGFVETCFRKVSGLGARSVKLGNAGLWALAQMTDEPAAAAELFRLRTRLRQPSASKMLEKCLSEYAAKSGQSVAEMEDKVLPTYGLDGEGRLSARFGAVTGTILLRADGVQLSWDNNGKTVKSPPAAALREQADAVAAFKKAAKDIEAARAAQAIRLEQAWVEQRSWSYRDWRANFLEHPLRRPLVRSLIWRISANDGSATVLPTDGGLETLDRGHAQFPDDAVVRLWHPLDSTPDDVLAWRERIVERDVVQPIKQAHREIYVLTDAERQTRIYSNRFAAHILRQHQFKALCGARGWRFEFLGGWDNWNEPHRPLPHHGLTVTYHVEAIHDGGLSEAMVPLHLTTDQVRFVAEDGSPVPLEDIPPVLFSECLRDVDLFVAVTSVANDPNWTDGGPDGRFGGYWVQWAFGELSQTAQTRRDLIARLAPKLAIAERLEVTDKFLIVQGKRQKYAIHFGSGNIQILPSKRYLCIVPSPTDKGAQGIKLPFVGDTMLSIILSKAILLTDEDKITDRTILAQL